MGASNSKIEDDKALALCRERKRLVKQALDGRCVLAAAHVAYVQSLRNTGTALRKFVDPEAEASAPPPDSSARVPYPSQQHADASNFSPSLSGRFQVNHMAAARIPSITIEERPPAVLEASVQTLLSPSKSGPESHSHEVSFHAHHMKSGKAASATFEERPFTPVRANLRQLSEDNSLYDSPSPPSTLPWDYFGLANILDSQFSIGEGKALGRGLDDNTDDIKRLREEEGIPELEDGGEAASLLDRDDDSMGSGDDDFDQISEDLVQIYRNRNDGRSDPSANASHATPSAGSMPTENDKENRDNTVDETSEVKLWKSSTTAIVLPMNVKEEHGSEGKPGGKDLTLCIKEIEILFLKASDSGKEVQRMLEANNLQFRPLFTEEKAYKWKASAFLSTCLACCKEGVHTSQAAAVPASNEMKYLTWHGSMSSRSSSSRIHLGAASKAEAEDLSSRFFGSACMNSGSHASTLDRLYAWERKLYDEVKASGFIRREYDLKCRQLRLQDSRAESAYRIDKTRAAVKDLHSRIRVAIHRINSISKSIEELRDKELQPQLEELIGGLARMWEMMLECHAQQHRFIMESSKKEGEAAQSEPLRQATLILQIEMSSLCSSFAKWISAQKSYLKAIHGWLLKCVLMAPAPKNKSSRRRQSQFSPRTDIAPPIFVTCRDWLALIDELPEKEVEDAMIDLIETAAFFLPRPEKASNSSLLSSSAFSLSRRAKVGGEKYEEVGRNREESAQWRFSYDSLQSGLVVFFDRLRSYADSSLVKYEALQKAIDEVRVRYENSDFRR